MSAKILSLLRMPLRAAGAFVLSALLLAGTAHAAFVDTLTKSGFQCLPATDASGKKFGGTLCTHAALSTSTFTLSEAFSIFVPSTTTTSVAHVVLYLQGFRGVCGDTGSTPGQVMNTFALGEQMQADSSADAILVFPMSVGNDTTYDNDFANVAGPFAGFMQFIESMTGTAAHWTLAGHSGAGAVISKALKLNPSTISRFDAIELLDAAYSMSTSAEMSAWKEIAQTNPHMAVTCIGNGTYTGCQTLSANAGFATKVSVMHTSTAHCDIPKTYFGSWLSGSGE